MVLYVNSYLYERKGLAFRFKKSEKTAAGYTHTYLVVGKFGRD